MRRRDVFAATVAVSLAATPVLAGGPTSGEGDDGAASLDIQGVGLPVIVDGRIRNYVFVSLKLMLAPSTDAAMARGKAPWLRDAIVRASYRRPFVVPGDWTRIDEVAVCDGLMRAAAVLLGRGAAVSAHVVSQSPRRRTGIVSA